MCCLFFVDETIVKCMGALLGKVGGADKFVVPDCGGRCCYDFASLSIEAHRWVQQIPAHPVPPAEN
jgi:hypothetical protein